MKTRHHLTLLAATACLALVAPTSLPAAIPGVPGLPGGGGGGGADINTVFDTYITSYVGMLEGQAAIAGALGLTAEQGKLKAEAERLQKDKGKGLDAAQTADKEVSKTISDKMNSVSQLDPEKAKLLAEGTALYAIGALKLAELVKQVKDVKKPGITDVAALPKFKAITTLPGYIKNVLTLLPTYAKFGQKVGVQPHPALTKSLTIQGPE